MVRARSKKVKRLQADAIWGFSELYLKDKYDGSKPTPPVHDEWWEMCCSPHPRVAIAAPRGHAKSTAITMAYVLASVCMGYKKYVVIVANTEDVANEFLTTIRDELRHNKKLRDAFGITVLDPDGSTNCVVHFEDGSKARIRTKGAGQRVRGMNWDGTRPDLVVIDDLEDDEAVMNDERRQKLLNWFLKALVPVVSREHGQIRMVGTILHEDSVLNRIMKNRAWKTRLYKAHAGFDDFSDMLWPELFTEEILRSIRQEYIDMGDPEGYSQEYLNDPSDLQNPFFSSDDFIPITEEDKKKPKTYYVGIDFALSVKKHSDYTAMVVGGYDSEGILYVEDVRRMRTDSTKDIVDEIFTLVYRYEPEYLLIEGGVIANAIIPMLWDEMTRRNKFVGIKEYVPIQDKQTRAAPIQMRMRAGGVRFDHEAAWYDAYKHEFVKFPRGAKDDQVDGTAWLGRGISEFAEAPTQEEINDAAWEEEVELYQEDQDDYDYSVGGY